MVSVYVMCVVGLIKQHYEVNFQLERKTISSCPQATQKLTQLCLMVYLTANLIPSQSKTIHITQVSFYVALCHNKSNAESVNHLCVCCV